MAKLTSPFNFVPLSDIVFYPKWSDMISHDIPFEDGEDGVIELEITNMSPLHIGVGSEENLPAHVIHNDRRYFYIPGTTLKGCFRNVMEILSYGKMEQFDDDSFGYREFNPNEVKKVSCGWLWKDYDKYYLEECTNGVQKIKHEDLKNRFHLKDKHPDDEEIQSIFSRYPIINVSEEKELEFKINNKRYDVKIGRYRVVCTGSIKDKNHEYLFSEECLEPIEVPKKDIERFETIHKSTPTFQIKTTGKGELRRKYDNGEKIPVFFIKDKSDIKIGLTQIFKNPYDYSIKDLVKKNYGRSWESFERCYDLPQCIFGYIGDKSMKGRVQIGNAFAEELVSDENLRTITGVLGQPKASFYPLYLQQDSNKKVVNYTTTDSTIAGRKRYRVSKDFNTIPIAAGNNNENVTSSFKVLPTGLTFNCRIVVHNLRKVEIGALLSSITFNMTEGCYHNIGMGKAFGYGIIDCKIKSLNGFKYTAAEYIDHFDEMMATFLDQNGRKLSSEVVYKQLVSIASPTHTQEDMSQMDFDTCEIFKNDNFKNDKTNASVLIESPKTMTIKIDENEAISHQIQLNLDEICKKADMLARAKDWRGGIKLLEDHCLELVSKKHDTSRVKELIRRYQEEERSYEEAILEMKRAEEAESINQKLQQEQAKIEKAKALRLEKGLAFLLESKVSGEGLKISSLMQGISRIKDFIRKNHGYRVTNNDAECVHKWLCSIAVPTKKQEMKDFQNINGDSWKYVSSLFSEAEKWFEEVNAKAGLK